MNEFKVGILGARSPVGEYLLSLLQEKAQHVVAFSRFAIEPAEAELEWRQLHRNAERSSASYEKRDTIERWICLAPIWALQEYFALFQVHDAQRIVAISSTSRFSKCQSSSVDEQALAQRLAEGEDQFIDWAERRGVEWTILRPTLIYGHGRDKNVTEIAHFIRRFRFFPLLGAASGLRQPVHTEDVAAACVAALENLSKGSHAYELSGGEILRYRDMVNRVFIALNQRPRFVTVPLSAFRLAINGLRMFPRYRHWSTAMAERMNQDLVFDHSEATRDLNFSPRPFVLNKEDVEL